MAYRIVADDAGVLEAVQRIAREQIEKARDDAARDDRREAVHEARKRCKKIRALVRLVRPCFEDTYRAENAWFRDAARELSQLRDATSTLECFDALIERYGERLDPSEGPPVRAALEDRREELEAELDLAARLERFRGAMQAALARVDSWSFDGGAEGYDAVRGGLHKTAKRAVRAFGAARRDPSPEKLHEWRKRVKYHRYHTRLLRETWPGLLGARLEAVHRLSDLLGDDHDLAVLRGTLLAEQERFGPRSRLASLLGLIDLRRSELEARALPLAARLHADPRRPAKRFVARMGRYWSAWQEEQRLERWLPDASAGSD